MKKRNVGTELAMHVSAQRGITLIALIITIVVMLILVSVTVTFTIGENGILSSAKEAKFKTEVSQLMEEYYINLEVAKMDKAFKKEDLYANKEIGNLKNWIPSIQEKYENKLHIEAGILCANSKQITEQEAKWLNELGIDVKLSSVQFTESWELSTTNNRNDTIEKYKGTLADGESFAIPKIIIDKTTGEKYKIERINECFEEPTNPSGSAVLLFNLSIPDNVTIAQGAFNAWKDGVYTENIVIGDNVVFEGINSFFNDSNLSTAQIGDNVDLKNIKIEHVYLAGKQTEDVGKEVNIGDNCSNFEEFYYFKTMNIGDNTTVSKNAGFGYRHIQSNETVEINIGKGLVITSIPGENSSQKFCYVSIFEEGKTKLNIEGIKQVDAQVVFPSSEKLNMQINIEENAIIVDNAFVGNSIKNVTIGKNAIIGDYAFQNCAGITKVTIEDGAQIGENAFYGCIGLKEVVLGDATIPVNAFANCSSLEKVTINEGAGANFAEGLFKDFTTIKTVKLGKNIILPKNIFYNTGIESLVINEGTKVGYTSFSNCSSLLEITIKSGTIIENTGTFQNCKTLTTVNIEEGVEASKTAMRTFFGCSALEEITIPNSIKYMGTGMFANCTNLRILTISEGENEVEIDRTILNNASTQVETVKIPSKAVLTNQSFINATIQKIEINKTRKEVEEEGLVPWGADAGVKVIYSNGEEVTY